MHLMENVVDVLWQVFIIQHMKIQLLKPLEIKENAMLLMVVVPMVPQERKSKKFMTIHTLIYDIYDMHMRYNHIVTLYIY